MYSLNKQQADSLVKLIDKTFKYSECDVECSRYMNINSECGVSITYRNNNNYNVHTILNFFLKEIHPNITLLEYAELLSISTKDKSAFNSGDYYASPEKKKCWTLQISDLIQKLDEIIGKSTGEDFILAFCN